MTGLTHQDLAESVGTYRETATQVLNDLKSQGLIEIGRKRIKLLDRETISIIGSKRIKLLNKESLVEIANG